MLGPTNIGVDEYFIHLSILYSTGILFLLPLKTCLCSVSKSLIVCSFLSFSTLLVQYRSLSPSVARRGSISEGVVAYISVG